MISLTDHHPTGLNPQSHRRHSVVAADGSDGTLPSHALVPHLDVLLRAPSAFHRHPRCVFEMSLFMIMLIA